MTRRAKTQPITGLQKFGMFMVSVVFIGCFIVVILKAIGMIHTDVAFFQYLLGMITSAIVGYLFGSNTRVSLPDG